MLLLTMEYIQIALPFSPFLTAVMLLMAAYIIVRIAARLIEVLPG